MGREDSTGVLMDRGTLYRVDNNPTVSCRAEAMVAPVSISNGLAWTADNRLLYYIDTPLRKVEAFDFDLASANISESSLEISKADGQLHAPFSLLTLLWGQ